MGEGVHQLSVQGLFKVVNDFKKQIKPLSEDVDLDWRCWGRKCWYRRMKLGYCYAVDLFEEN